MDRTETLEVTEEGCPPRGQASQKGTELARDLRPARRQCSVVLGSSLQCVAMVASRTT